MAPSPRDWPALSAATATLLARRGVRLLGVDAPSVDRRESKTLAVHHALFGGGAQVLENLDLRGVREGSTSSSRRRSGGRASTRRRCARCCGAGSSVRRAGRAGVPGPFPQPNASPMLDRFPTKNRPKVA